MSLALLARQRAARDTRRPANARRAAEARLAADARAHSFHSHLRTLRTPADGNCLFSSIAEILSRSHADLVARVDAAVIADVCPDRAGARVKWTPDVLRRAVAASVLRRDSVTDAALGESAAVARGAALPPEELRHFLIADASGAAPMSDAWRAALASAMSDRRIYWGDAYALYVLEGLLRLRFIVLGTSARARLTALVTPDHGAEFAPLAFAMLLLGGAAANHYTPLLLLPAPSLLFTRETAPEQLLAFLRATTPPGSPYAYLW